MNKNRTMKRTLSTLLGLALALATWAAPDTMQSPNGKISLTPTDKGYTIRYEGKTVMDIPEVGITTSDRGQGLRLQDISKPRRIKAKYTMLTGKCLRPTNEACEYTCNYRDQSGKPLQLVMRLYNDGIAFRYEMQGLQDELLTGEQTTYCIPEGTRRWMQEWSEAYEGFFPMSITGKARRQHWGYPALLEPSDGVFALITEANIERRQSASSLRNEQSADLFRVCPDKNELRLSGQWHTPWRLVIIGRLADVVESTLVTDVAEPSRTKDTKWIMPGVVSWIYWAHNHGSNDLNIIKQYIDMAATLKLPYMLIDAEWDEMKDGKSIEDAIRYAHDRGVRPMIWYNSSTAWINGAPGPKYRLNKAEDREKEFAWCEKLGVAGVKIDFFAGDTQATMDYCIDLLECAARHHLLVNFHGATIPRGWQRTYPNLMSTEGVYGAEWYNNLPVLTNRAASHNATLPFTRNVVGPMDYTPCTFSDSQHPHITTHAHELALTVLFESGLQHLADRPESYLAQPQQVQQFLSRLPSVWDETRFVDGYPGKSVIMARRSGTTWYVAGINGLDEAANLKLSLDFLPKKHNHVVTFFDSSHGDSPWTIRQGTTLPTAVHCKPRGGFVIVIKA